METDRQTATAAPSRPVLLPAGAFSFLSFGALLAVTIWSLSEPVSQRIAVAPFGEYWSLLVLLAAFGLGGWLLRRMQCRILELEQIERSRHAELERARTELTRVTKEAKTAERAKSEFLAAMSHELRTPLNAIIGFAEILNSEMLGPLGRREYVEYSSDIRECGHQLLRVVNDILDLSRAQSGGIELIASAIDLPELVQNVLAPLRQEAARRGVTLRSEIPNGVESFAADERRLQQMLAHLIGNGIKFTPAGGRVTVAARSAAGRLDITVADTGIGIAKEHIAQALTPFGQVDGRRSREFGGTGLGLPLTRSLVSLHGGTFDITSTPGEGTTVTLAFPYSARPGLPKAA